MSGCFKYYKLDTSRIYTCFLNIPLHFLLVNIEWTSWSDNKFKYHILFVSHEASSFLIQGVSYSSLKRICKIIFTYFIWKYSLISQILLFVSFIWLYFFSVKCCSKKLWRYIIWPRLRKYYANEEIDGKKISQFQAHRWVLE